MNPESLAMFRTVLTLIVCAASAGTLYTIFAPMLQGDKLKKRMSAVSEERDSMRRSRMEDLNKANGLRKESKGFVKQIVENLSLEKLLAASDLKDKLAQAGLRGQRPIYTFYFFRLAMPILLFFFGIMYFVILNPLEWTNSQSWLAAVALVLVGYYAPGTYLKNAASKRMSSIAPVFPDALDLLLICVESGMSIEMAFGKVAREMAGASVELAEEFSYTTAELSYLQSRRQAYENLGRRNNHPGIKAVSTALIQAERYGTPLGDTLRTMADENRQMRVMAAEKKAAALPAKLTVPMIVFFLPVLFIVILTPAAMRIQQNLG